MTIAAEPHAESHGEHTVREQEEIFNKTIFGFWLYIMSDCALFSALFATYGVLHGGTFGGPTAKELFSLPAVFIETMILLTSSFTCGLALIAVNRNKKGLALFLFGATFLLGAAFLGMELQEFSDFIQQGASWERSGFLSSFFTLVGTHGAHIVIGLFWMLLMMFQIVTQGINYNVYRRLTCLSLFWHFLDLVWIFIFTIVYLTGVIW